MKMFVEFDIPENCVAAGHIVIVRYMDEDGEMYRQTEIDDCLDATTVAGLLEEVKYATLRAQEELD